jgi:hypothetical protein
MSSFIVALVITLGQMVLMLVGTGFLSISNHASKFIHQNFSFLESYVPVLRRYSAAFGQTDSFDYYFSIHLFQIVLQLVVIAVLTAILLRSVKGRRPEPLGFLKGLGYFAVLALLAGPSVELFWGPYDIGFPGYLSRNTDSFVRCIVLPGANFLLFFFISARFLEPNYTRLARHRIQDLEPAAYSEAMDGDNGR